MPQCQAPFEKRRSQKLDQSEKCMRDRDKILADMKLNGLRLELESDELKKDREIVLTTVKQDGRALRFASDELKNDRKIVLISKLWGKENFKEIAVLGILCTIGALGVILAIPLAPIAGLVCTPIFAVKALLDWLDYRPLLKEMLSKGAREKFGRVAGQDYTRLDGKQANPIKVPPGLARRNKRMGVYPHGKNYDFEFTDEFIETAFNTQEDLEWLELELKRKKAEELLKMDLKRLRASAIALIPFFGAIWVLLTEIGPGRAISRSRPKPFSNIPDPFFLTHWYWDVAMNFHIQNLKKKLQSL